MKNWDWKLVAIHFFLYTVFFIVVFWLINFLTSKEDESFLQLLRQSLIMSLGFTIIIDGLMKKEFRQRNEKDK